MFKIVKNFKNSVAFNLLKIELTYVIIFVEYNIVVSMLMRSIAALTFVIATLKTLRLINAHLLYKKAHETTTSHERRKVFGA